jgi:hypothetical protein
MTYTRPDDHAVEAAVLNDGVQRAIEEFGENMRFAVEGLPRYGLEKIARRAAFVALEAALNPPVDG